MLEGFIDYSNDLGGSYAGSYLRISNLSSQLNEQRKDYEKKLEELNAKQEKLEARIEELEDEV
jgi:cell division protein FtsB